MWTTLRALTELPQFPDKYVFTRVCILDWWNWLFVYCVWFKGGLSLRRNEMNLRRTSKNERKKNTNRNSNGNQQQQNREEILKIYENTSSTTRDGGGKRE